MSRRLIPVSTLVSYLKGTLEEDPVLKGVLVEGEISNLRKPYSGHWYFSLKDSHASISCVMFAGSNRRVDFSPVNGDKVEIRGDVSVYEAGGSLQIIVTAMRRSGVGDLYRRLEELKKKLNEEGLFDASHKKSLPAYPMNIALVTGNNTAAREDVLITFRKRWPCAVIHEYPAPVQGNDAPPKIIDALKRADLGNHDIILLVRGGGSIEDLWCFNDEALARTVYDLKTPVVTGIGHEIDFTLCDFTADVRANTPTGAVETAVPDIAEVTHHLKVCRDKMVRHLTSRLQESRIHLDHLSSCQIFENPESMTAMYRMQLDALDHRLMQYPQNINDAKYTLQQLHHRFYAYGTGYVSALQNRVNDCEIKLHDWSEETLAAMHEKVDGYEETLKKNTEEHLRKENEHMRMSTALLDAYSPLKILSRGYSVVSKDGQSICDAGVLNKDDTVTVRFHKGSVKAVVEEVDDGRKENEI